MLAGGAALSATLAAALSFAYFTEVDPVSAAIARAKTLMELMDRRSPGERVAGVLIKTKHRHYRVLAERSPALPIPVLGPALVDVLSTPATLPASEVALPPVAELLQPPPLFPPPPGACCTGHHPPPPPPPPPPAGVPEPGTWMTMLLGFAVAGWMLRRRPLQGKLANG